MNTINSLKFKLLISGLISGILSTYLFDVSQSSLYYMPGVIFGIVMFLVFYKSIGKNLMIRLVWILGSTFAYYMAVRAFIIGGGGDNFVTLFLAGAIGGFIMITFFHLAFFELKPAQFFVLTLLGGLLAFSMLISKSAPEMETLAGGFSYLFIIWQAGMALALGWAVDSNQQMR